MEKELKIVPPEGYEIDRENSTFECIKFKHINERWRDDERFGGPITDEEWSNIGTIKYVIYRDVCFIAKSINTSSYRFLAFHTGEQRDLFLEENKDLIKDYFML